MLNKIIIAHRGCHDDDIPENSIGAFKEALDNNLPIEFDVHILKDNEIVVFHDDNLLRMTGIDKEIETLTFDEIKNIKLKNTNEKIPLLKDVLDLVDGKVLLDIELKTNENNHMLENELLKILSHYEGQVILKSFNYKVVKYLKKISTYTVGILYTNVDNKKIKNKKLINYLRQNINFNIIIKPDFIGCNKKYVNDKSIKSFKGPILVWTIKNKKDYDKFKNTNYGLISEYNLKKH